MAFRLTAGELPHGWQCPDDDEVRAVLGCDSPGPGWWMAGAEERIYYRCPLHEMTEDVSAVILSWRHLHTHHTWPAPGGLDQQATWFVEAAALLDSERAAWEAREMERRRPAPKGAAHGR